jgi:ribosomal protein S12 methylthiotransferase accessory factor
VSEFRLKSCPKHYTVDQDKTVAPTETVRNALERLKKQFDLSNIKLERRQDEIEGAYSFASISDQMSASGKGLTPEQSQASAIMEFAERYSWLHFDYDKYEGYTVKSYREIVKGKVPTVKPEYFLNNFFGLDHPEQITKEILDVPLKWIKALSLNDYSEFYYPINWHNYIFTSNGLATGNAMEEAIMQALCELIERENIARLLRDQKAGNDLDQASITNPLIRRVLDNAKKAGISFVLKEISFELGVPTFLAYGIRAASRGKMTYKGAGQGTHPNPEKALIRALSEYFEGYSQMKKVEDDIKLDWEMIMPKMLKKDFGFFVNLNPGMIEEKRNKVLPINKLADLSRPDIKDEIGEIMKRLKKSGHHVYFIDKTQPRLGIPVCRMFIPGFRSVLNSETYDPWLILSEVCFEAGDEANSEKYLKRSLLKMSYYLPKNSVQVKPRQAFKQDYRETLLAVGGAKKTAYEQLQKIIPAMSAAKR